MTPVPPFDREHLVGDLRRLYGTLPATATNSGDERCGDVCREMVGQGNG